MNTENRNRNMSQVELYHHYKLEIRDAAWTFLIRARMQQIWDASEMLVILQNAMRDITNIMLQEALAYSTGAILIDIHTELLQAHAQRRAWPQEGSAEEAPPPEGRFSPRQS